MKITNILQGWYIENRREVRAVHLMRRVNEVKITGTSSKGQLRRRLGNQRTLKAKRQFWFVV